MAVKREIFVEEPRTSSTVLETVQLNFAKVLEDRYGLNNEHANNLAPSIRFYKNADRLNLQVAAAAILTYTDKDLINRDLRKLDNFNTVAINKHLNTLIQLKHDGNNTEQEIIYTYLTYLRDFAISL